MKTIVIVSGFFDPLGIQHLKLFTDAAALGDYLVVGVNSDECGARKKQQPSFMPFSDRVTIVKALRMVDEVVGFVDTDGTACALIQNIYDKYKSEIAEGSVKLLFANGGDRTKTTSPEDIYVERFLPGLVTSVYGVGGDYKTASSSDYLRNWVNNTLVRYDVDFRLENKY